MAKYTHHDVDYREGTPQRRCAGCTMFVAPNPTAPAKTAHCTAVDDPIRADGVCNIYRGKT